MNYSEQQLIELLTSKNEQAFSALYDKYSAVLYGIISRIVDEEIAQDVLQDSFLKIWKNISQYDSSKGSLFTWMLNIARNTAIDANRSAYNRKKIRLDDSIVSIDKKYSTSSGFDHIGLENVLKELKPEYQRTIFLLYFMGHTQEEAAKELNVPLGTLKTWARAALNKLRDLTNIKIGEY